MRVKQIVQRRNVRLIAACVFILLVKLILLYRNPAFYRRFLSFRYTSIYEVPSQSELRDAGDFLAKYRPSIFQSSRQKPDFVITVVTVFREKVPHQYIYYTMRALILGLGPEVNNGNVQIAVCSGDHAPGRDAYLQEIRKHFLMLKPKASTRPKITIKDKKNRTSKFEKERQDYVFCLNETMTRFPGVEHLLMLEDDAPIRLSGAPFLTTLRHFIDQASRGGIRRFAFMKLYHPPRLLGYLEPEWDRHLEGLAIVAIVVAMLRLSQWLWPSAGGLRSRIEADMSWRTTAVCLLLLLYTVDRYWILEVRRLSKYLHMMVPAPFCCTPGILFQRQSAVEAVNFIGSVCATKAYGKDAALYDYYRKSGLPAWYIQPNLVQHIGFKSTLHPNVVASTSL